eukprot:scaffold63078_cov66-Phaeocystis_antarctica.AAC.1
MRNTLSRRPSARALALLICSWPWWRSRRSRACSACRTHPWGRISCGLASALRAECSDLDVSGVLQRLLEDGDVRLGVNLLALLH